MIDMTVGGQTNKQPTFTIDSGTEKVTSNQDITKATPKEIFVVNLLWISSMHLSLPMAG